MNLSRSIQQGSNTTAGRMLNSTNGTMPGEQRRAPAAAWRLCSSGWGCRTIKPTPCLTS